MLKKADVRKWRFEGDYVNAFTKKIKDRFFLIPKPAKAAIVFTIATFMTQGLYIITTPIFTRIMSTEDIGIVTLFNSWNQLIGVIAGLGLTSGSFSIAMMEYKQERSRYISSVLFLSTISSLILFLFYLINRNLVEKLIGLQSPLVLLLFIGFIFNPATNFWIARQKYEYKYKKTAILSVLISVLSPLFAICAILLFGGSDNYSLATIRLYASSLITLPISIMFYIFLLRDGKLLVSKKYWKFAFKLSIPLVIHALAKQVLDISDRIMIQHYEGLDKVGIYGILYSVGSLSLIAWGAINSSLIPFMFQKIKAGRTFEKHINSVINQIILFYAIICIFLILIAPELVRVLATSEYYEAIYLMPPIAAGIFFTSLYNIYSNVLLYYKKTKLIMLSTVLAAIVNVILNYIFIPRYGFIAAAYTTLISFIVLAYMQFLFMKVVRKDEILFDDKSLWIIAMLIVIFSIFSNLLYYNNIIRIAFIFLIIGVAIIKRKRIFNIINRVVKRNYEMEG